MWATLKDWLLVGALPEHDDRLVDDLTAPGFHLDRKDRLVLESKESMAKRGVASPDDGDALALTFAKPMVGNVRLARPAKRPRYPRRSISRGSLGWMS